ncbi:MAG TPA: cation:proton antiporter [Telluria sp.]|nr:cation:proton antiporter [Telluria sp.]
MPDLLTLLTNLSWPIAIAIAWLAGEFGQRWTGLPRISFYGIVGFALASTQLGALPATGPGPALAVADVAFGLILFELGYRINLRWFVSNPWLFVSGLAEAALTFGAVYFTAKAFGTTYMTSLMLASLAMSTSPATVVRIVNEQRSSGQVTERVMHLAALNCVLSVFAFNVIIGFWIFHSANNLQEATLTTLLRLVISIALGGVFGFIVPALLRHLGSLARDATVAFAISVVLLVAITYSLQLSSVVATLGFGLMARHRRVAFSQAQRNFGALGELLTVLLFVYAAATLDWEKVVAGGTLALAVVAVSVIAKTAGVAAFSKLSGISWRKGALTGFALAPVSVFVILLLEHARTRGLDVIEELRAMAAVTMLLEVFGPIIIQRALIWARESQGKSNAS